MKMMTTMRQIEIIRDMFDLYVEPVASSFMCGEVPSTVFEIHRRGTREGDWLAFVRFRNTLTISVFKCEVYLEDIVRLCRRCKIWLLTEPVYEMIVTYYMLHPLYQSQCIDFAHNIVNDYESMLADAGRLTYRFIKKHFHFYDPVQKTVLEILHLHNQLFTNRAGVRSFRQQMEDEWEAYKGYMMNRYPMAYKTSIHFKASISRVDADGFIHLDRREEISKTEYISTESVDEIIQKQHEEDQEELAKKKQKRAFSKRPPKSTYTPSKIIDHRFDDQIEGSQVTLKKRKEKLFRGE